MLRMAAAQMWSVCVRLQIPAVEVRRRVSTEGEHVYADGESILLTLDKKAPYADLVGKVVQMVKRELVRVHRHMTVEGEAMKVTVASEDVLLGLLQAMKEAPILYAEFSERRILRRAKTEKAA